MKIQSSKDIIKKSNGKKSVILTENDDGTQEIREVSTDKLTRVFGAIVFYGSCELHAYEFIHTDYVTYIITRKDAE